MYYHCKNTRQCNFDLVNALKPIDHKEYNLEEFRKHVGASVVVQDTGDGRGRGVFAHENIGKGQLIHASTAIAIVSSSDPRFDPNSSDNGDGDLLRLLQEDITSEIQNDEQTMENVYDLCAGDCAFMRKMQKKSGGINEFRIQRICELNSFEWEEKESENEEDDNVHPRASKYVGLWTFPSYLNHTCIDFNAEWRIINNIMLLHATAPILKGQEITINYLAPRNKRARTAADCLNRKAFFKNRGITCDCRICSGSSEFEEEEDHSE